MGNPKPIVPIIYLYTIVNVLAFIIGYIRNGLDMWANGRFMLITNGVVIGFLLIIFILMLITHAIEDWGNTKKTKLFKKGE